MLKTHKIHIGILPCLLLLFILSHAQDSMSNNKSQAITALYGAFPDSAFSFPDKKVTGFNIDSIANQKLLFAFHSHNRDAAPKTFKKDYDFSSFSKKPLIQFRGGYVNYNWNYRSSIDTPFAEKDISQHFITSSIGFTIAQSIPLRIVYFGRQTNSELFRDFNDFRVEFDMPEFNKLRRDRLTSYINDVIEQIRDPRIKPSIQLNDQKVNSLQDWLTSTPVVNTLLQSREKVIASGYSDSLASDSTLQAAKSFIAYYDSVKQKKEDLEQVRDSLLQQYVRMEKAVQKFQQAVHSNTNDLKSWSEAGAILNERGIGTKQLVHLLNGLYAVKTFSVGKTMPAFSNLTVKNIGVKGINFEYNNKNLYLAFTAGTIDYRVKDFIYKKQNRVPEYLYASRLGYGRKEGNNLILTYFKGKRQLFVNASNNKAITIDGISLSSQLLAGKNTKIIAEVAQSISTAVATNEPFEKPYFSMRNRSSSAISVQMKSFIPLTKTKIEGFFQYNGMNFQSFTAYKVNAVTDNWLVKAEQALWKRQLYIAAAVQKNNFNNPYVLQRYNANTIFKSINATFRKRQWPSFTLGYMPSSQYTVVDSAIYESHYQIFNAAINHQYKVGMAQASSSFMYNRFFNNSLDSGFIFYNSNNYYFNQIFYFPRYIATLNISHAYSDQYTLNVLDMAIQAKVFGQENWGVGTKVNLLNNNETKVGYYITAGLKIEKLGCLSIRLEESYLPGFNHSLIKSQLYNVGFTRYIQ